MNDTERHLRLLHPSNPPPAARTAEEVIAEIEPLVHNPEYHDHIHRVVRAFVDTCVEGGGQEELENLVSLLVVHKGAVGALCAVTQRLALALGVADTNKALGEPKPLTDFRCPCGVDG